MKKFFEIVKGYLDNGNDVILSTNNNGYIAFIKHEFEFSGSVTIVDYNENTDTLNEVNVPDESLHRYFKCK